MTVSRREFVAVAGGASLALAAPALHLPSRRRFDLVIRGGTIFDGSGADGGRADLGISGDRIAAAGPGLAPGALEIDARDLAVSPGFIDIHSHADGSLFADPRAESVIRQGVTTVIVGQDGSSHVPRAGADDDNDGQGYGSMAAFFTAVDQAGPSINLASMVGLGSVRGAVIGDDDRPATEDELRRMTALVAAALDQGACGASTGLEYTPGAFASREELIALCRPLASRRLPYATHMRNEDDRVLEAVDEAIAIASGAGCPLEISHLKAQGTRNWGKLDQIFARIAEAKLRIDIAFDRYPYVAYQTTLANLFPASSRDGGTDAFLARLTDSATAAQLKGEALAKVEGLGGWDHVMISSVADSSDRTAEGQRMGQYAAAKGDDPYALTVALLTRSRADVGMVGFAMSEDNLERILAHPLSMVCSDGGAFALDGPAHRGHPHPRGLGSFPRVLATYVRQRKVLTLAQAIHKMSGFAAGRLHLRDRGRLAPGAAADVVVFDPHTVSDQATFADPFQYPTGISAVIVNGKVTIREGEHSAAGAGKALKPA